MNFLEHLYMLRSLSAKSSEYRTKKYLATKWKFLNTIVVACIQGHTWHGRGVWIEKHAPALHSVKCLHVFVSPSRAFRYLIKHKIQQKYSKCKRNLGTLYYIIFLTFYSSDLQNEMQVQFKLIHF